MEPADKNTEFSSPPITPPVVVHSPLQTNTDITTENTFPGSPEEMHPQKTLTPFQDSLRRLQRDRRAMASLIIILLFVILPTVGTPLYQHIGGMYHSPSSGNIGPDVYHSPFHTELARQD